MMSNHKLSRGEVWFINLDSTVGHEQAKTRPCLIISNDIFNHGPAFLHTVLPITFKNKNQPLHILAEWLEGGAEVESFILCDQIRTVSRQRFTGKRLGTVTSETLESVENVVAILLDL